MKCKQTGKPIFSVLSVVLACPACREAGKASECIHLLHLVPRWQSGQRHTRLKTIMQVLLHTHSYIHVYGNRGAGVGEANISNFPCSYIELYRRSIFT